MSMKERLSRTWQPVRRRYAALNPTARRMTLMLLAAGLVLFLCSPAADTITGTAIPMDGGWTAQ